MKGCMNETYSMRGDLSNMSKLGHFHVISAFCGTSVAQNVEIAWKSPSSEHVRKFIHGWRPHSNKANEWQWPNMKQDKNMAQPNKLFMAERCAVFAKGHDVGHSLGFLRHALAILLTGPTINKLNHFSSPSQIVSRPPYSDNWWFVSIKKWTLE